MSRERRYLIALGIAVVSWSVIWLSLWPQAAAAPMTATAAVLRAHGRDTASSGPALALAAPARGQGRPIAFDPIDVAAISPSKWFVLGRQPSCFGHRCPDAIIATDDRGRSFTALPPLPVRGASAIDAITPRLLVLSTDDGRLWITADGGRSWHAAGPAGLTVTVPVSTTRAGERAARYLYAVAWRGAHGRLERAPLRALRVSTSSAARSWRRLPGPRGTPIGLLVNGRRLLLLVQAPRGGISRLYRSNDDGWSFTPTGAKLAVLSCSFTVPAARVIWADCSTGMLFGIWRSTDGGRSFRPSGGDAYPRPRAPRGSRDRSPSRSRDRSPSGSRNRSPSGFRPVFAGTSGAGFGVVSARTALLGLEPLYRTTNGGESYVPLRHTPARVVDWLQLTFQAPGFGLALGTFSSAPRGRGTLANRLYRVTRDGTRFQRIRLPSRA